MNVIVLDEPIHPPVKTYKAGTVKITDITSRMYAEKEGKLGKDDPMDMMRIEAGFVWEECLNAGYAARQRKLHPDIEWDRHKPEARCKDDIWMGPDFYNPEAEYPLEEWKATKKSSKHNFEEAHWWWMPQLKGYALGWRTLKLKLRVWYINGDYSWESKNSDLTLLRDYVTYAITFTKRDLLENWQMLLTNATRYGLLPLKPVFEEEPCQTPRSPKRNDSQPLGSSPPPRRGSTPPSGKVLKMRPRSGS